MGYAHDLHLIKECLDFFYTNDIEQECIEYESEAIQEILERVLTVMEKYQEEQEEEL